MRSLETTASQQNDPEFIPNDDVVINLEHVIPASFDNSKWSDINKSDAEAYLNRIGNMCLLQAEKNSDAANLNFEEKKKIYKASAYLLTNQLAELDKWGIEEIEKRQKTLAELAVKTWSLEYHYLNCILWLSQQKKQNQKKNVLKSTSQKYHSMILLRT